MTRCPGEARRRRSSSGDGGLTNTSTAVREHVPDLQRPLHVDLEEDVVPGGEVLLDRAPRGALEVAVDLEPLEEAAGVAQRPRTRRG